MIIMIIIIIIVQVSNDWTKILLIKEQLFVCISICNIDVQCPLDFNDMTYNLVINTNVVFLWRKLSEIWK